MASLAIAVSLQQRTKLSTLSNSRRRVPLRRVSNDLSWMHCKHDLSWMHCKHGQSTLQQLGVKACGYDPAPKKATNLLSLHAKLGAQFGTKFFAATALTTRPDPDTSNHSLKCDMFEPDPKHRGAMLRTELAPALNGLRASMLKWMACGGGARWRKCCVALSMRLHASLVHVFTTRSNATSTCL